MEVEGSCTVLAVVVRCQRRERRAESWRRAGLESACVLTLITLSNQPFLTTS